jgi:RHS repeat-associated protein
MSFVSCLIRPHQTAQIPQVSYLTNDHLGSPRITTDANGNVFSRRDFHPFGEEVFTGQRTQGLGYAADNVRQKFTSYERDNESSLDFAQARYFSYNHGRFTSPDDFGNDSDLTDPQSWNKYAYVRNNPLNLVDPTGEKVEYQITVDTEKKTVTVTAIATFGIWSSNSAIKKDLSSVAKNIEKQIEGRWKGQFKEGDWKFDFNAQVSVQVFDKANSTNDVSNADNTIMNIIEIDNVSTSYVDNQKANGPIAKNANPDGLYPDTGKWDYNAAKKSGEPAHEFGHLQGPGNQGTMGTDLIAPGETKAVPQAKSMSKPDFDLVVGYAARQNRDYLVNFVKNNPNTPYRRYTFPQRSKRICCN